MTTGSSGTDDDSGVAPHGASGTMRHGITMLLAMSMVAWLLAGPQSSRLLLIGALVLGLMVIISSRMTLHRRPWSIGSMLAVGAGIAAVVGILVSKAPLVAGMAALLVLLGVGVFSPVFIVRGLWLRRRVDAQMVLGAISIYLMVGLGFTMLYATTALLQDAPLFNTAAGLTDGSYRDYVYFSFVTLSTTGYGDFTPNSGTARALAILEALGGQLYLVTAVATAVSLVANQAQIIRDSRAAKDVQATSGE